MVPVAAVARLAGQVVDGRAHAVPEARVLAFRIADGGAAGGKPGGATADLDGHFSIDGLTPGSVSRCWWKRPASPRPRLHP